MEGVEKGHKEGREEGRDEGLLYAAKRFLKKGLSALENSETLGLPLENIEKLKV